MSEGRANRQNTQTQLRSPVSEGRANRQYRQTVLRSPMSEGRANRQNRKTLLRSICLREELIDSIDKLS